jgi:hypothetical protein
VTEIDPFILKQRKPKATEAGIFSMFPPHGGFDRFGDLAKGLMGSGGAIRGGLVGFVARKPEVNGRRWDLILLSLGLHREALRVEIKQVVNLLRLRKSFQFL